MRKVKIRLPATITDFGPSLRSLGLALSLYTEVELSPRNDEQLLVETEGEGAGRYALGLRHPVVLGMLRVFQLLEQGPPGISVRVRNNIPLDSGLGAESAFITAGIIGANNLMGSPFNRSQVLEIASEATQRPDQAVTSILGGLTAHTWQASNLIYRTLSMVPFRLILAMPRIAHYNRPAFPERIQTFTALASLSRQPILIDALATGDIPTIASVLNDDIQGEEIRRRISGFGHVAEVARLAGAQGITTSGGGPAIIFFADLHHDRIAEAIETAFNNINIPAIVKVLPIDTQGVVVSLLHSA